MGKNSRKSNIVGVSTTGIKVRREAAERKRERSEETGLLRPIEESDLYSEGSGEPGKGFQQTDDTIRFRAR